MDAILNDIRYAINTSKFQNQEVAQMLKIKPDKLSKMLSGTIPFPVTLYEKFLKEISKYPLEQQAGRFNYELVPKPQAPELLVRHFENLLSDMKQTCDMFAKVMKGDNGDHNE